MAGFIFHDTQRSMTKIEAETLSLEELIKLYSRSSDCGMSNRQYNSLYDSVISKRGIKQILAEQYKKFEPDEIEEYEWTISYPRGPVAHTPFGLMEPGGGVYSCNPKFVRTFTKEEFIKKGWYKDIIVSK